MDIDAKQIERVLSQLARLRHHCDREQLEVLESLRPAWMSADAWDVVLEDLETQRYKERPHERPRVVKLQLAAG